MKAVVQKPIQSLHAFGRHSNRGRNAALPLVFRCRNMVMTVATVMLAVSATAQQTDTGDHTDEKRLDLLFDRIMQALPGDMRSQVDSAGSENMERHGIRVETGPKDTHEESGTQIRMRELPEELKSQVERAITDLEKRKEERKAKFRETRDRGHR